MDLSGKIAIISREIIDRDLIITIDKSRTTMIDRGREIINRGLMIKVDRPRKIMIGRIMITMIDTVPKLINRDLIMTREDKVRTIMTSSGRMTMTGNGGNIHKNGVIMIANGENMKVIDIGRKCMPMNGMIGIGGTMIMGMMDSVNFYWVP